MNTTNEFIKLPNDICSLQGLACRAYLYITYLCTIQQSDTVKVKQETIRQNIGAAFIPTVHKAMHKLQDLNRISITNNFNSETNFYTCSSYKINNFNPQKDYFLLPAEYVTVDMPPMAYQLMLTLYMYSFNDAYSFPSYTEITKITGMSSASISKSIRILEEKGIIKKENYIKKDGSKGHNRYFIIKSIQRIMQSDKAVKLLQWIREQKQVGFEVWQIIKEVIRGNLLLLDEICSFANNDNQDNSGTSSGGNYEEENNEATQSGELFYDLTDGIVACSYPKEDYTTRHSCEKKHRIFGRVRDGIKFIQNRIRESVGTLFRNFKTVLLRN